MRLWLVLAGPLFALLGVWIVTVLAAAMMDRRHPRPCPSCLHAHPPTRPCVHPLSWDDRVRMRNQVIEMERREKIADDRFMHGDRRT